MHLSQRSYTVAVQTVVNCKLENITSVAASAGIEHVAVLKQLIKKQVIKKQVIKKQVAHFNHMQAGGRIDQ